MAAGGMGRADDRLRASLAERRQHDHPSAQRPDDGRPCWVVLGADRAEGMIHAWWRDTDTGSWHALVIAWLPASSVQPRDG